MPASGVESDDDANDVAAEFDVCRKATDGVVVDEVVDDGAVGGACCCRPLLLTAAAVAAELDGPPIVLDGCCFDVIVLEDTDGAAA